MDEKRIKGDSMKKNLYAVLLIAAVLLVGGLVGWWIWQSRGPRVSREQLLYEKNCAVCHGVNGDGK
ncbi:MAG: c-type cytochrome, partial [Terriglobia bacterium]